MNTRTVLLTHGPIDECPFFFHHAAECECRFSTAHCLPALVAAPPAVAGFAPDVLGGNGLNLMQVGAYAQTMAIGGILIFAIVLARH